MFTLLALCVYINEQDSGLYFQSWGKEMKKSLYTIAYLGKYTPGKKEHLKQSTSQGKAYFKGELIRCLCCIAFNDMSRCNGRDIDRSLFIHQEAVAMVINLERKRRCM